MKKFILPLILALIASPAFAETVFLCNTTGGKQIKLVDNGDTFTYQFGKAQKPELVLKVAKEDIIANWNGKDGVFNDFIEIPNQSVSYSVFSSLNKNTKKVSAGVTVYQDNASPKTIFCNPKQIKVNKIESYGTPS
ncbi:hypothetical protein L3D26_04215 [Moraxella sp. ZY21109]|uniref:hypothetical protein n=1 Tax=Moraxella sp. ZY21109 TaxID=2911969 RepID=UPI003D7CAFAA